MLHSHADNRLIVAAALADVLVRTHTDLVGSLAGVTESARSMTDAAWSIAAQATGRDAEYTPAPETQRIAIALLHEREKATAPTVAAVTDDPFAGLTEADQKHAYDGRDTLDRRRAS